MIVFLIKKEIEMKAKNIVGLVLIVLMLGLVGASVYFEYVGAAAGTGISLGFSLRGYLI
jgi:hypothetical protein